MAYTYAYTGVGSPSSIVRSDGPEFPQIAGNPHYDQWVVFTAGGGTTTAAPTVTLDDRKDAGKAVVAKMAADAARLLTDETARDDLYNALRLQEAIMYERLEISNVNDAQYPLLGAEVPALGADVDAVHDVVLAEANALKADLIAIAEGHADAVVAIDAATDQAEIDAAIAAADLAP